MDRSQLHSLRVRPGDPAHLDRRDQSDRLGILDKAEAQRAVEQLVTRLSTLQHRLFAEDRRSLLLVLQGMDAAGKDGTIRKVFTGINPQGCTVVHFQRPVGAELDHDYLWRVHQAAPARGQIGIFNRSHYEDVVAAYLTGVIDDEERQRRFGHIRHFEAMLTDEGTHILKVFLHISRDEQALRLQARIDDPEKRWKIESSDLAMHEQWHAYQDAYGQAIEATSTDVAPWYVVPADLKWVRDVVVAQLLVDALAEIDPKVPAATLPPGTKVI